MSTWLQLGGATARVQDTDDSISRADLSRAVVVLSLAFESHVRPTSPVADPGTTKRPRHGAKSAVQILVFAAILAGVWLPPFLGAGTGANASS